MTQVTFLVGLPASGKSTWRENSRGDAVVASSDDFIDEMAKLEGKSYNEIFKSAIDPATKHFNHMVSYAVSENRDLIVDRTNLTVEGRRKILARIPFDWKKVAIVFKPKDFEVWRDRLMGRPGKVIPAPVLVDMMLNKYERPTTSEGFDRVVEYLT